ncbi:MAG: hypothetical protein ACLT16_13550 [[Clostridium] innocuum]
MLKLFTPDYYIHSFSALRPEYLKEHGIRLLSVISITRWFLTM